VIFTSSALQVCIKLYVLNYKLFISFIQTELRYAGIRCSHSGGNEEFYLLGYNAMQSVKIQRRFGSACRLLSHSFLPSLIVWRWRWRRHALPKRRLSFNGLHDVIGAHNIIVGWGTMLQAGRSWVLFLMRSLDFFNWPNPSSRSMALGSTQPLTEMSTRNIHVGKGWLARKADLTAIWEPRRLTTVWASMACYRDSFTALCLHVPEDRTPELWQLSRYTYGVSA
jgi:hypothetical protein